MVRRTEKSIRVAFVVRSVGLNSRHVLRGVSHYAAMNRSWHLRLACGVPEVILRSLRKTGVDGVFITSIAEGLVSILTRMKLPCIALQCTRPPKVVPYITAGSFEAGRLTAEYYLRRGFRHFAFFSPSTLFWAMERMEGFRLAVEKAGFTANIYCPASPGKKQHWEGGSTWIKGGENPVKWLRSLPKPVGLMACDDTSAYDLVEAACEAGILIPEEVAVVGMYNEETLCNAIKPPLSSVAINLWQAGYDAAELLNDLILGKKKMAGQQILARATHVVTRQSSDVLAIEDHDVATAINFIRRQLDLPIRVTDVAIATKVSRRTLEKKFMAALGRPVAREIARLRVEHVASLLLETDLSIDQITAKTAFESTSHMIKTFKKYKGVPPRAFRKAGVRT